MMNRGGEFERIREALRFAIERQTLRHVAIQVGMSPSGLQLFVDGTKPYGKTREKVRAWFYREAGMNALPPDDAVRFLRQFVGTLPEPDRAIARLLDSVESLYREQGMLAPGWVGRVRSLVTRDVGDAARRQEAGDGT